MVTMGTARGAFASRHMTTHVECDDKGKIVRVVSVRKPDAPSFRQWARDEYRRQHAFSPKLERIVQGGR